MRTYINVQGGWARVFHAAGPVKYMRSSNKKCYRSALAVLFACLFVSFAAGQSSVTKAFDFNMAPSYQIGSNATTPAYADFNSDGKLDMVTVNRATIGKITLIKGDGAGGFGPPQVFDAVENAYTLTAGDLNNDGKQDVVVASYSNKIAILLNDGAGGFLAPAVFVPPSQYINQGEFYDIRSGDFNGDGNVDIVVLQYQTGKHLKFFMGDGSGTLTLTKDLVVGSNEAKMSVGRLNPDGYDDVIVSRQGSYTTELVFVAGNAAGNFAFGTTTPAPAIAQAMSIADINKDGNADVVLAVKNTLQSFLGNGAGGFSASTPVDLTSYFPATEITAADFNNDGNVDLAAAISSSSNPGICVMVIYGLGDGTFENRDHWDVAEGSTAIRAADVNGDGRPDILATQNRYSSRNAVSVLINTNNLGFAAPKAALWGGNNIDSGDFNGDHFRDFVSAYNSYSFATAEIAIATNDPVNGIRDDKVYPTGKGLLSFKTGDFNGDGKMDVITIHDTNTGQIELLPGDGTGVLSAPVPTTVLDGFYPGLYNLIVGDFNGDGKDDVYINSNQSKVYVYCGTSGGILKPANNSPITVSTYGKLVKGDFNSDGNLDVVNGNKLWLGDGTGQFALTTAVIPNFSEYVADDFNGDGKLDLAGFSSGSLACVPGDGTGNFGTPFTTTLPTQPSVPISGDFNGDGWSDIAFLTTDPRGNLEIVPSGGSSNAWQQPVFLDIGAASMMIAADFNGDGKPDIGTATVYGTRNIIYNTSGTTPSISISDISVTESDPAAVSAVFTVSLSASSEHAISVNYTVASGTAVVGTDLENVAGRLDIPAGQTSGTIMVPITNDILDEFDETFTVNLASPSGAAIARGTATGTIVDNDAQPTISITDFAATEGGGGSQYFTFNAVLSAPSGKPVSFRAASASGTAVATSDFNPIDAAQTIPPGNTSVSTGVYVFADSTFEMDEEFYVNLSAPVNVTIADGQGKGTILNDDPIPSISVVNGPAFAEGDTGTVNRPVTIQLSNPTYLPVTLNLATSPGSATPNVDYVSSDTRITIQPEQQTYSTSVGFIGDTVSEPFEVFYVNIYDVANANIYSPQAQMGIVNDDFTFGDFDGDLKTDLSVFRPSDAVWYISRSASTLRTTQFGLSDDTIVPADYTGDGKADMAIWRPSTGTWYVLRSENSTFYGLSFGSNGDIPIPGDFDGDNKADLAVYRPSQGTWFIQRSTVGFVATQFGTAEDRPTIGDFDGDGRSDVAVFRPSTGIWYRLNSSNGAFFAAQFGQTGDRVVPADYSGDGKTDLAIWRPSNGTWYIQRSEDNSFYGQQFGLSDDLPVPGDYDGDGKADVAVFRPGTGTWFEQRSTSGFAAVQFGTTGDKPAPNAFVF